MEEDIVVIPNSHEAEAFPHAPWQFAWKSPQWHSLPTTPDAATTTTTTSAESTSENKHHKQATTTATGILGHAAARIQLPQDIPQLLTENYLDTADSSHSPDTNNNNRTTAGDDHAAVEYLLTVTLQNNGTDLELQVWKQPQAITTTTRAESNDKHAPAVQISLMETRALQWPSVMTNDEPGNEVLPPSTSSSQPQQRRNRPSSGLVALTLARKPPEDALAAWTDALDVLHWLSLDRSTDITPFQRDWLRHLQQQISTTKTSTTATSHDRDRKEPNEGDLLLLCLDAHNVLHAYHVASLWQQSFVKDNNEDGGLAAFLLGEDLLSQVQTRIWPLTQPWQQVSLGVTVDVWGRTLDGPSNAAFSCPPIKEYQHMVTVADLICLSGGGDTSAAGDVASQGHGTAGVCTFVSLRTLEEVRRVALPFVPQKIFPWHWNGWVFVLCVGGRPQDMCAIRVDAGSQTSLAPGDAPSLFANNPPSAELIRMHVGRFQILPVIFPTWRRDEGMELQMVVASTGVHFAAVYRNEDNEIQVVQYKVGSVDALPQDRPSILDVYGMYRPPHLTTSGLPVLILNQDRVVATLSTTRATNLWCYTQHGWGLLGVGSQVYWIGWQGQRQAVAYCHHIATLTSDEELPVIESVQSLEPWKHGVPSVSTRRADGFGTGSRSNAEHELHLPESASDVSSQIVDAMESISSLSYRGSGSPPASPLRRLRKELTQKEKSQRLLRQCSNWTRLEFAEGSTGHLNFVEPIVSLRTNKYNYVVTVRQVDLHHTEEAPFDVILSWLAHHKDYFTAASLSLDLLQDGASLRLLWESYGKINRNNATDYNVLEGLLDGIADIQIGEKHSQSNSSPNAVVGRLADMTIGCLIRGGYPMSTTLEQLVLRDIHYNASRAILMLVATAAYSLTNDDKLICLAMGADYEKPPNKDSDHGPILWPIRCLLNVGVARDVLNTALLLLNATIPEVLRNQKASDLDSTPIFSLSVCKQLVSLIVGSSPDAPVLLLGLIDEQSRVLFWDSLDHETQLELSLVQTNNDTESPMLLQSPVRNWVLSELQESLTREVSAQSFNVFERTPHRWLRELVVASLRNARCSLKNVFPNSIPSRDAGAVPSFVEYCNTMETSRALLLSSQGKFGIDFDMMIAALLLVEGRGIQWQDGASISSQQLLNASCYFAGRRSHREPIAPLNAPVLMRQCFLAGNVQAGANLIGGKNGLILWCCQVLISAIGLEVDEAEKFLREHSLPKAEKTTDSVEFVAGETHYNILWPLREHTLLVKNYGDFNASSVRGKIDPVEAAHLCLKTWWRVSWESQGSTQWLVQWLQDQLEIKDNRSSHRLACAALLRALIWPHPDTKEPQLSTPPQSLAALLCIPNSFLTQLALSACGLVEAVPADRMELPPAAQRPLAKT